MSPIPVSLVTRQVQEGVCTWVFCLPSGAAVQSIVLRDCDCPLNVVEAPQDGFHFQGFLAFNR
jgi:hypothetical protein